MVHILTQRKPRWVVFQCISPTCTNERWPVADHEREPGKVVEAERCPRCDRIGEPVKKT